MEAQSEHSVVKRRSRLVRSAWVIATLLAAVFLLGLVILPLQKTSAAATSDMEPFESDKAVQTNHTQSKSSIIPSTASNKASYYLQVAQDLAITKTHSIDFAIGSTGVYTINVENVGTDTVSGEVIVSDTLPSNLTPIVVTGAGWSPCGFEGNVLTCVYSNTSGLPVSSSLPVIRLSASVGVTNTTLITNSVALENANDANPLNDIAFDQTQITGVDLSVSKSVQPVVAAEGGTVTYTLQVENFGPQDATAVVLTDKLPTGVTYISSQPSEVYSPATGIWGIGTILNGDQTTLTLTAQVNSGTGGTTITNSVEGISFNQNDYNVDNNSDSVSFIVSDTGLIGLVSDASNDNPIEDVLVEFTDSVDNLFSTTTNADGWFTFTSTITDPIALGQAQLVASLSGYQTENLAITIEEGLNTQNIALDTSDLLLEMSDGRTTVIPGQIITYTIDLSNIGTLTANNVVITDVFPAQITYITDTLDITHTVPAAHTYVWKFPNSFAPDDDVTFQIRTQVDYALPSPVTVLSNAARASTTSLEANTDNNVALDSNSSTGTANPSITLSVSPSQARTNQNVTYTIVVKNNGTAAATDVIVTDTFSSYLNILSAKTTKGTAVANTSTRKVTVSIDVLDVDETATITVVARVNTTASSNLTISNSASMTYKFGGSTYSKSSNVASFQLLATSTLPGTGGFEQNTQQTTPFWLSLISAVLLGLTGLAVILYGVWRWRKSTKWDSWYLKFGMIMTVSGLVFLIVANLLSSMSNDNKLSLNTLAKKPLIQSTPVDESSDTEFWVQYLTTEEPEVLPDFPIPEPTFQPTAGPEENSPDTSPVVRIAIPALNMDTVVKYVPYDGLTWLIGGLKQEVAWMGDTSWPGLGGNTGLAGHVTLRSGGFGPFRYLSNLQTGDRVYLYTEENVYTYRVNEQRVVEETDMSVLQQTDGSTITLITCTDWDENTGFYKKRLAVSAVLDDIENTQTLSFEP